MQQYAAFPAAVTVPFVALYMAFHDTKEAKTNTCKAKNDCSKRFNVIGSGKNINAKLAEIDIPEKGQCRMITFLEDSLNWIAGDNATCNGVGGIFDLFINFFDDVPGNSGKLLTNFVFLLAFQMIMKHSILGILSKILWKHLVDMVSKCCAYVFHQVCSPWRTNHNKPEMNQVIHNQQNHRKIMFITPLNA